MLGGDRQRRGGVVGQAVGGRAGIVVKAGDHRLVRRGVVDGDREGVGRSAGVGGGVGGLGGEAVAVVGERRRGEREGAVGGGLGGEANREAVLEHLDARAMLGA